MYPLASPILPTTPWRRGVDSSMRLGTLLRAMLYRASLVVAVAVRGLRGLWRTALSWSPQNTQWWGRREGAAGFESSVSDQSSADGGFGAERWEEEFFKDPLDLPQARLQQLGVCSQESRHSTQVLFRNGVRDPPQRCRLFWLDYAGKIVRYKTLDPGETHRQQTFESHPWTFATVPDRGTETPKQRLVVNGAPVFFPRRFSASEDARDDQHDGAVLAVVERPLTRNWTHETHKHYPGFFKTIAKAFLVTHAVLRLDPEREDTNPRRSPRLLEKQRRSGTSGIDGLYKPSHPNASDSAPNDIGPASAEDGEHGDCELEQPGRSSMDSVELCVATDAEDGSLRATAEEEDSFDKKEKTTLGDLPPELAARIIALAAPRCPLYRPITEVVQDMIRSRGDVATPEENGLDLEEAD